MLVPSHFALIWYQHLPLWGGRGLAEVRNNVGCACMALLRAGYGNNGRQVGIGRKGWFQICPVQRFPLALQCSPSLFLGFAAAGRSHLVSGSQRGVATAARDSVCLCSSCDFHSSFFSSSELELYILTELQGTLSLKGLRLS